MTATTNTRRVRRSNPGDPAVKTCPECAEEVRAAARKCRYCSFRFEPLIRLGPDGTATKTPVLDTTSTEQLVLPDVPATADKEAVEPSTARVPESAGRSLRTLVPRSRRRRLLAVGVVVAVVMAAAGAMLWMRHVNATRYAAAEQSARGRMAAVSAAVEELESATPRNAAVAARDVLAKHKAAVDEELGSVDDLAAGEQRDTMRTLLSSESETYAEVARVLDLKLGAVTSAELAELASTEERLSSAARAAAALASSTKPTGDPVDVDPLV